MPTAYLCLGSNLGNKRKQLITASAMLSERAGDIPALSDIYESKAWGYDSENSFLNLALKLQSNLSPYELLKATQQIEKELGRLNKTHSQTYSDRTIDIDILLYDDLIIKTPELTIPHPQMHKRLFVLEPLTQIAPQLKHPIFNQSIFDLKKLLLRV